MACRESRSSGIFICLGLLMFVVSLCHCKKMTRLKALDEKRENTARTQSKVEKSHQHHGRLLIGQNSQQADKLNGTNSTGNEMEVETDYQADMGWWQTKQLNQQGDWPYSDMAAMRRLLEMESKVECTRDSMKLFVQDAAFTPASLIYVDRGLLSPLSLSKLPTSCGYTIRSTQRDLVLVAPYDGCFVVVEENSYVLPLRWWGLPVRMSCPLIEYLTPNPPMVTCHTEGMVVKTEWANSASDIKVNVNGNWEPLLTVAHRCVFGLVEHPEGLVISVRYEPCLEIQDGLYTLELAADGETKISCPSLLPAPLKPAGNVAKGPAQQSEEPSQWMNPFAPNPTLNPPPVQTGFQIPGFPQYPEIPSQPMQTDEQFLYTLFSSLYYPDLTNMEAPPTQQPESSTPTKPASTQATDQSFSYFPFYHPQLSVIPPTWPPVTEPPPAKNEDALISYPFIFPPMFPQQPASDPKGQEPNPLNPFYYTQTQSQAFLYPLYLEKLPEKLDQLDQTMAGNPQGEGYLPFNLFCTQETSASKSTGASWDQVDQPFYLVCTQLKPALEQTAPQHEYSETSQQFFLLCNQQKSMTSQSNAESSQNQVYQPFYLLCVQWKQTPGAAQPVQYQASESNLYQAYFPLSTQPLPTAKPEDVTQPPQPPTPQPQFYQQFLPFYSQPPPTAIPAVTQPPQGVTPQGQEYLPFFPFYPIPNPTRPAATLPPQPATPQPQFYQQFFPFYTQPKPADVEPPQPATPPSKVYQPVMPFYTQPQPTQPAVQPPQPTTPQPQVYQQFFPLYTQPKPDPKPDVQPPQPATPPSKVYQPLFNFYSQSTPKPAADTWSSQSSSPQGQAYQPFFNFYTPPKQTLQVTQPPPLLAPQSQVNQHSFPFKPKQPLQPALSEPLQPDVAQAPVSQLFNNMQKPELQQPSKPAEPQQPQAPESRMHLFPYQLNMQPKPATRPTAAPQPLQPETLQGQAHQQMCLYTQLLTESQLANMPTKTIQGKVYGPCQQSGKPGAETPLVPKPVSPDYPVFCPQFCPSGLSSCCLQIAFHQHFHFSGGRDDKDVPQFYMGLPSSQVVHYDPSMVLEAAQIPQKLTEAAILQTLRTSTPAHFSPWALQTAGQKQEYFKPPDGNPAAQSKTDSEVPASPNFQTDSSYHYWSNRPLEFNGPPKPRAFKPVEQDRLSNIQLPNLQTSETVAGSTRFMPNGMSYTSQHGSRTAQQTKPDSNRQALRSIPGFKSSSHHNFKRAIDRFAPPYFMPQDAPELNKNDSSAQNNSQAHPFETISKNSTNHQQVLKSYSGSQSYVLLQDGPPGKKPSSFSEPLSPFWHLVHDADSTIQSQQPKGTDLDLALLQEKSQTFIKQKQGPSNPSLGHKSGLPSFSSVTEDSDLVYLQPEHYFSAVELKPDVLESFEEIRKSLMPPGSSQLFAAHVSGKNKEVKSADQPANGINLPLKMENGH